MTTAKKTTSPRRASRAKTAAPEQPAPTEAPTTAPEPEPATTTAPEPQPAPESANVPEPGPEVSEAQPQTEPVTDARPMLEPAPAPGTHAYHWIITVQETEGRNPYGETFHGIATPEPGARPTRSQVYQWAENEAIKRMWATLGRPVRSTVVLFFSVERDEL